jgi:hypothetical protein
MSSPGQPVPRRPYDDMTDKDLTDLATRTLLAAAEEPPNSVERAMKFAAYDSIVAEAQRRVLNQISADLGLPPIYL